MKILDAEIEFDFFDADESTKIEKELNSLSVAMKNVKGNTRAEQISNTCDLIINFFVVMFKKEGAKAVFKGKRNWNLCFNALEDVFKAKEKADKEMGEQLSERNKKYERYIRK